MTLSPFILKAIWSKHPDNDAAVQRIIEEVSGCISDKLLDDNYQERLLTDDGIKYWQQLSEILVYHQIKRAGLRLAHKRAGPDIITQISNKNVWIEIITPEPSDIPCKWKLGISNTFTVPNEKLLLRWTAAIKEKSEKWAGSPGKPGYLQKSIVSQEDAYVIAINARLLRRGCIRGSIPQLYGVSQWPFAVEATLGVGPIELSMRVHENNSIELLKTENHVRIIIPNKNKADVHTGPFLDKRMAHVSAIWALDIDENSLIQSKPAMAVVHNPHASNPIPIGSLPCLDEYVASIVDEDTYDVTRIVK